MPLANATATTTVISRNVEAELGAPGVAEAGGRDGMLGGNVIERSPREAAGAAWSGTRPLSEQLPTYPATCFLVAVLVTVFLVMWRRRVSAASMGSSYRNLLVRQEWWRVVTAAVAHSGLLHLAFNITSLWSCRRIEAELGSWGYLLASAHFVVLAEVFEKMFMHALLRTGRVVDEISCGYSGVVFAWIVVLSLRPDTPAPDIGGFVFSGFASVVVNLVVVRILIRQSSFVGHLAGVWAGLLFSTGALDFARQDRYWSLGLAAWALAVLLGSLKATTTIPIPLIDYVDLSGRNDLGVGVAPLDWSNREWLEDWAAANA
ncbi:unnamed protein product [Ectocarpus sp. CCAP 1310/34]|nr:unnamed protein product [Ectocarpus sp. CCAP 1310/34]